MEYIPAKTILSKAKNAPDSWFGLTYSMNLYRGCQHQCIYCDSRSECYQLKDLANIEVKENAIAVLEKELKTKKLKGTIGTGSMNDPYMPVERQLGLTQKALTVIKKYHFPVHVLTKSNLVLRDIDLLSEISKTYAAVSLTITTADDTLGRILEPAASLPSERFDAIKVLSDAGIYSGVLLMPLLPFINDTSENVSTIVEQAKNAGAKYIIGWMGMTLRDKQRDYYYEKLNCHFPGLKEKYMARYGNQYSILVPDGIKLQAHFDSKCKQLNLPTHMAFFNENRPTQLQLF